jgi:5,10-methylenetetrahydromethanopterin reductase
VLDRHSIDRERASAIGDAISAGEFSAAFDQVTDQMLDAFCVAGTPKTVAEKLDTLLETADSVVIGSPVGPDIGDAITLLGESPLLDQS